MHQERLMVMKSCLAGSFLLFLSSSVSGLGSVVVKQYDSIQMHYTWKDAQAYCRSSNYYTDLAFIRTQSDEDSLYMKQYNAWVGLQTSSFTDWCWCCYWPNGLPTCIFTSDPKANCTQSSAYVTYNSSYNSRFYGAACEDYYFFICEKSDSSNNKYTFVNQSKKPLDAQQYCQQLRNNLAIIWPSTDLHAAVEKQDFPVWTGLYRDAQGQTWKWSTGSSNYSNWAPGEPRSSGDCGAISSVSKKMTAQNCSDRFPFVCYRDNLVLVKENKTWEEALAHCRALGSFPDTRSYELVSVQPGDDHMVMVNKVQVADTNEVWAGLRFLAGHWFWVNGADLLYSDLPFCPPNGQHCGALSKTGIHSLDTRDCLEKRNFLCYSTPY